MSWAVSRSLSVEEEPGEERYTKSVGLREIGRLLAPDLARTTAEEIDRVGRKVAELSSEDLCFPLNCPPKFKKAIHSSSSTHFDWLDEAKFYGNHACVSVLPHISASRSACTNRCPICCYTGIRDLY